MYRKNIIFIILTLIMWIAGINGVLFVFNQPDFLYNILPSWSIYAILAVYIILVIIMTIITIRKILKTKNKYRKYYDI